MSLPYTADLDDYLMQLGTGAEALGLQLLSAQLPKASVYITEDMPMDRLLGFIAASGSGFFTVYPSLFDSEEHPVVVDAYRHLQDLVDEHDGDVDGLMISWIRDGLVYTYLVSPSWLEPLSEYEAIVAEVQAQVTEFRELEAEQLHAYVGKRGSELAAWLEQQATFRATHFGKEAIGRSLIAKSGLLTPEDVEAGDWLLRVAVETARGHVRDNTLVAFQELRDDLAPVLDTLRTSVEYQCATNDRLRKAVIKEALIQASGGYVPTLVFVTEVEQMLRNS